MSKGLYCQASYTLARNIYDLTHGSSPEDAFNRARERAVAQDIPTHRINVNWVYELPFGKGRKLFNSSRVANWIAGGWEMTGM